MTGCATRGRRTTSRESSPPQLLSASVVPCWTRSRLERTGATRPGLQIPAYPRDSDPVAITNANSIIEKRYTRLALTWAPTPVTVQPAAVLAAGPDAEPDPSRALPCPTPSAAASDLAMTTLTVPGNPAGSMRFWPVGCATPVAEPVVARDAALDRPR